MQFGYFTLSDNHYENNPRTANQLVADILDEAVYAEEVGLHSAWIGEHHFSTLGVLSCPDLVLAQVAARTKKIRLAPAVTVLPLHHPIRVAEQWATLDLLSGGPVVFAARRGPHPPAQAPASGAAASILPPGAATTRASTSRSGSRSPTTRESSRKAWSSSARCGVPR